LNLKLIVSCAGKSWSETAGVANRAGGWKVFKFTTFSGAAAWVRMRKRIW
jgi:hypothetical protein